MDTASVNATLDDRIRLAKQAALRELSAGRYAEARSLALKIMAAQPNDPEALVLLAKLDAMSGNIAVARTLLARASALAPNSAALRSEKEMLDKVEQHNAGDEYVQLYLTTRAMFMDYPMNIQLETVGRCNANCTFCPHEELERKFDEMSDELFAKIIGEAATIPPYSPLNFYLNVINEPFMDRKIFPRIAMINAKIPHATLGFYTNMNVLPRNCFENLRQVRNLTSINVSFNAANEAEYEESMRIDFKRTVKNVRELLAQRRAHAFVAAPISLSRIATLDERDQAFARQCEALFPEFENGVDYIPMVKRRANWLGQTGGEQTKVPVLSPCMQWLNISVFCDGTVPHCCMDANGKYAFGNVKEQSLLEIYNSPKFRIMREAVIGRGSVHPCNTCALA